MSDYNALPGAPLPDHRIRALAMEQDMITPFEGGKRGDFLTYGLGSYGYDVRLGDEIAEWDTSDLDVWTLDPAKPSGKFKRTVHHEGMATVIDPGDFALAHTVETLDLPRNVIAIVHDKSTYARCGIAVQNTVLEPGWRGQVTLELSNHGPRPVRLYPGHGIAQILFYAAEPCENDYGDQGRYQDQRGVVPPKGAG